MQTKRGKRTTGRNKALPVDYRLLKAGSENRHLNSGKSVSPKAMTKDDEMGANRTGQDRTKATVLLY